jgi:uridylate kinase
VADGTPQFRRILLKVSGDGFAAKGGSGLHGSALEALANQVLDAHALGVEVAVVVGGGNLVRGAHESSQLGIVRAAADQMGMLATVINGLALQDVIERRHVQTRLMTAIEISDVAEPFIRRRALRHLEQKRVVILAAGTGNPYFTTDTAAALRAMEVQAQVLLKATKVDGVYSADPLVDPKAVRYDRLTYMEVLKDRLKVMDATAISLCMENNLPIVVFNLLEPGSVRRVVLGEKLGTVVGDLE